MTRKRFHKLFRSEMTKLMAHKQGAAGCIKVAANAVAWAKDDNGVVSYQKSWDALRCAYIYPGNTPPLR